MHIPISEQETVIQISRDSDRMKIWTTDTTMMTKLDKLCSVSEFYVCMKEEKIEGDVVDKIYTAPKTFLSFLSRKRKGTPMTEERKARLAEWRRRKNDQTL